MPKYIGVILLVIINLFSLSSAKEFGFQSMGYKPVADPGRLTSLYHNPAGLGFNKGFGFLYSHSHNPHLFSRDKSFSIGAGNLGFGLDYLGQSLPYNYRRYNLGFAESYKDMISFGIAYRWNRHSGNAPGRLHQWDIGTILRPNKYISLGLIGESLNRPKSITGYIQPTYTGGFSIRPYSDFITLSAEFSAKDGDEFDEIGSTIGFELQPAKGFTIGFEISDHSRYGFNVELTSLFSKSTGYYRANKDGDALKRIAEFEVSSKAYPGYQLNSGRFLKIDISKNIVEENRSRGKLFNKNRSLLDILTMIKRASKDNSISGILLELEGLKLGTASVQELRKHLIDFRKNGKVVVAFGENISGREYYLAASADKVYMVPSGYLNFSGIRAEVTYFKGLMDKLGLEAEIIATGEYKTAGEIVTNEEMSDADREQINDLLDDFYGKITIDLAQDRNVKVSQMVFTIDQGPFIPQEALSKRLIDGLFYRNQLDDELRRLTSNFSGIISSSFYEKTKPEEEKWGPKPAIAVVYATGELKSGKSSSIGIFSSGSCGSETLSNSIISAADNPSVKAIVLRVDSPGGELTASDIILNSIEQAKLRKPVIVSMGDVAASGGYYISCNADKIFAEHSTITGSIGVIAGKLVMKGLYDKIGLKKEIITRGKNATFFSTYKHSTEAQQEKANSQVAEYYENFIEKVSTGRYLSIEMVDSLARGRVWSGLKAVENGLVDQLGGLSDAINEAKMMMNIEGDCDILIYPKYNFFFSPNDLIKSDFTIAVEALGLSSLPEAIPSTGYHYIMPYRIDIK